MADGSPSPMTRAIPINPPTRSSFTLASGGTCSLPGGPPSANVSDSSQEEPEEADGEESRDVGGDWVQDVRVDVERVLPETPRGHRQQRGASHVSPIGHEEGPRTRANTAEDKMDPCREVPPPGVRSAEGDLKVLIE